MMATATQNSINSPKGSNEETLSETEVQMLDICVSIVKFIGLPKSVGELYGLLFISQEPLSMDDLILRLKLSKGATSQGLKELRTIGAIKTVYVAGERRDYFQAETNLSHLVSGFLKERVAPGVDDLGQRLATLEVAGENFSKDKKEFIQNRLDKLNRWRKKTSEAVPALNSFLIGP
ncbi:MAG: hypothetical protein AAGA18_08740 [Verrucomicrobiota bacterium]